jgi:hypothetical protein
MPRYDYAAQIARLGIKRNQASTVPGVDARTERRYAANPDRVPAGRAKVDFRHN